MSHPRQRSLFVPWSIDPEAGMRFLEHELRGREVIELIRDEQWLEVVHVPEKASSLTL
jgi:hypothetical protein